MSADQTSPKTIDEYIAGFPPDVQENLQKIRNIIRSEAPGVQETIKYLIPTFTLQGNLLSFAAYKAHIGLYPAPVGDEKFNQQLQEFRTEKSTIRFPLDKPIPFDLIREIVRLRVQDTLARAEAKRQRR